MLPAKKLSGLSARERSTFPRKQKPPVVSATYEKHNISIFLRFSSHPFPCSPIQLLNFYEKNPRSTTYFILDTMFFLCL